MSNSYTNYQVVVSESGDIRVPNPNILPMDANRISQEENWQSLDDETSEQTIAMDQLGHLQREVGAMEDIIMAVWTRARPHMPEFKNIPSASDIGEIIQSLSLQETRGSILKSPRHGERSNSVKDRQLLVANLKAEISQQGKSLDHYKRMESITSHRVHQLSKENKKMKIQLEEVNADRQRLKVGLELAMERARQLENCLL